MNNIDDMMPVLKEQKKYPPAVRKIRMSETYQYTRDMSGEGMWFHTDCGNWMYSVNSNPMFYHGKLCPKCLAKGKQVTLYMRSTAEANQCLGLT